MKNPYYYKGVNPTVDLIIVNPEGKILLIKRKDAAAACPGMWAIPGGFIDTEAKKDESWKEGLETPEQAAVREVKEETNLDLVSPKLEFIGAFEGSGRDPRDNSQSWSKSYAFIHVIPNDIYEAQKDKIKGLDDAEDADWKSLEEISNLDIAFDHKRIIALGVSRISLTKDHKKPKMK